ncbi:MAG: flagellar biosynthesis anti-sigma factor FlgM [Spirochaetales bacterium]|nr:flagellar biosynthesis anti-sigma factor FlgM [Spirochaetales bacterium]
MTIDRIGPLDPLSRINKTQKTGNIAEVGKSDSVEISHDAKKMAELYNIAEKVKNAPEVREDRIAEVKAKLDDPNYINDSVIETIADKLANMINL